MKAILACQKNPSGIPGEEILQTKEKMTFIENISL